MVDYFVLREVRRAMRRERVYLDRTNPLEIYDDIDLIERYRFPRSSILQIIEHCHGLQRPTRRSKALPVHLQVLTALRFYATGTFQIPTGDTIGIKQSSVSRCISGVTSILCSLHQNYIRFPTTPEDVQKVKLGFNSLAGFPNCIGLIDGTYIFIKAPSEYENCYVGRKGGHSLNTQIICDHDMKITSIIAKWPGATNDSFIWKHSSRREIFVHNPPNGWLIGDSGYGIEPWLITPLLRPGSRAEERFNDSLKSTRCKVENCIGLYKNVFKCNSLFGGASMYEPVKICKILIATAILHNIRRDLKLDQDENFRVVPDVENQYVEPNQPDNIIQQAGNEVRRQIITDYFTR